MKKIYEKPELEVVKLEVEDIIATSGEVNLENGNGTVLPDDSFP